MIYEKGGFDMGGFLFNGCGAADSFYPKKSLGMHYCKYCHSIKEYALMEVKRKIRVVYIPTFSITTKYAVGCTKCKNGYYIEDNVRDEILYGKMGIEMQGDEIKLVRVNSTYGN